MSLSKKKCCVPGCLDSGSTQLPLHIFPNPEKDRQRFNTWVMKIGGDIIGMDNDDIYRHRSICHAHFEEKYLCRFKRLSNIAVPSLNLPGPLVLPQFTFGERRTQHENQFSSKALELSSNRIPFQDLQNLNIPSTSKDPVNMMRPIDMDVIIPALPQEESKNVSDSKGHAIDEHLSIKKRAPRKVACKRKMACTITERALYKQLLKIRVQLSKCRNRSKKQALTIKKLSKITSNTQLSEALNNVSSTAKVLTMLQLRENKKKDKGRRFTMTEKIIALSLMKQSPKGYRFLRKIFILPAPHTLLKLIKSANIKPGLNENIKKQIMKATEKMNEKERLCVVLFDEMALKTNVTYNESKDKVIGFSCNGQETRSEYADHAQVFMVRGLVKNYKQPISYTFSQAATKGPELAKQLKAVIKDLQQAGLIVVATVCDQGTNNTSCIKLLINETKINYLRKGHEARENVFEVNGTEIIPLYDTPHLIKGIRNNLLTKDLLFYHENKKKTAKWSHLEQLHKENPSYKGIRMIPKLSDSHIVANKINKMKVKFATQILSQTVATHMGYLADKGILSPDCKDTADVLLFWDEVFDSVNGSYGKRNKSHGKPLLGPVTPNSIHHQLWLEARHRIKDMKFVNRVTGRVENVPTLNNWVWTLEGLELLVKKLNTNYNVTSVWLRHLNQDPIENFFGAIRSHGCRNTNPTPERFESAFASLLINSLSSVHAPGANCEEDNCKILQQLIISSRDKVIPEPCEVEHIPVLEITPLEDKKEPHVIGPLQYISGYFLKKTKQKVFKGCEQCKNDLINNEEPEYIRYRQYRKGKKWLYSPSNALLNCVSSIQDINYCVLRNYLERNNLKQLIKTMIFIAVDFDFIKCETHNDLIIDYIINLSSRFFIYNYCKEINKILNNRQQCDDDLDNFKIKAKKYFYKCNKRKNK